MLNVSKNISRSNLVIHKKRKIHYNQEDFIPKNQSWFSFTKAISVIHHTESKEEKKHMTISNAAEKAFNKIQVHL